MPVTRTKAHKPVRPLSCEPSAELAFLEFFCAMDSRLTIADIFEWLSVAACDGHVVRMSKDSVMMVLIMILCFYVYKIR